MINNTLKDFPLVEYLCEEQKDCIKTMVCGRCLCNPSHRFWKELNNLSTLSMSYVFDEWKSQTSAISMIMVVCLTLVAITKGQVGQLNKIGVVPRAANSCSKTKKTKKL